MYIREEILLMNKNFNINRMRKDYSFYEHIYDYCLNLSFIESDITNLNQIFWHYKNSSKRMTCECGKNTNFDLPNFKYFSFCSRKCSTKSKKTQDKLKDTCFKKYGTETFMSSDIVKNKLKNTCLERYGIEHIMQHDITKEKSNNSKANFTDEKKKDILSKMKKTNLERYGVEIISQSKEVQEKYKNTCLERFGVTHPNQNKDIILKRDASNIKKYGVKDVMNVSKFKEKRENTCLERYGVRNAMQNIEVFSKRSRTSFLFKEYKLPSGKIVKVQGREPQALDILLKTYNENDIVISTKEINNIIGVTRFIGLDNKDHFYFPDFYIKSTNTIIEVKSKWTYNLHLEGNLLKEKAIKDKGINFEFMIIN